MVYHPLLSGHVTERRKFRSINAIYVTLLKDTPLTDAINFSTVPNLIFIVLKTTTANIIQLSVIYWARGKRCVL